MQRPASNSILALGGLGLLALATFVMALGLGSVSVAPIQVWLALTGDNATLQSQMIMNLRLPRALNAFACGGLLALAGALMQTLLRNPLAEPYVLGVSGGAAVGALTAMLLGIGGLWLNAAAFLGAFVSILLVFVLAHGRGSWTPARLLLTGIVIAAGWSALVSFILSISPSNSLRGMLFWLMGDLSPTESSAPGLITLGIGLLLCLSMARNLTLLSRGDLQARALGVAVEPLRYLIYAISALLTAVAVTQAGTIGFVGLVVPHLVRLLLGNDQRLLLPASVLLGGSLLLVADTLARIIIAPQQLPVGVLTAMIGVPLFLYLLNRSRS